MIGLDWDAVWHVVTASGVLALLFMIWRNSLMIERMEANQRLLSAVLLAWATTYGDTPDQVKEALGRCLDCLANGPIPPEPRKTP